MTEAASGGSAAGASSDTCYRHPDRRSFVLCQRCGRTVCPQCQVPAAVGVHCPECVARATSALPKRPSALRRAFRPGSRVPVVTYGILALTLVVYALQWISSGAVSNALAYFPPLTAVEPWRMLTTALVHSQSSFVHILFNMYSLFVLGPLLEQLVGRARFATIYVLSALGGSAAVALLAPTAVVVGASGAIFGLLGAFFVIQRRLGGGNVQLIVIIALNLVLGFIVPNVAWEAHVGGLLVGALCAWVMLNTRRADQSRRQVAMLAAIAGGIVAVTVVALAFHGLLLR